MRFHNCVCYLMILQYSKFETISLWYDSLLAHIELLTMLKKFEHVFSYQKLHQILSIFLCALMYFIKRSSFFEPIKNHLKCVNWIMIFEHV